MMLLTETACFVYPISLYSIGLSLKNQRGKLVRRHDVLCHLLDFL